MHFWKYYRQETEKESGSHRLVNQISVVSKIFPKLIRNEITKHLDNFFFLNFFKEGKEERGKENGTLSPWLQEEEWLENLV